MTITVPFTRADGGTRAAVPLGPADFLGKKAHGSAARTAVLTLTAAIICQPLLHPTGPGNSSPVDLLTVASIVTAAIWLAGTHRKLRAPYILPMLLYVGAGAASGLVSLLPGTALITLATDLLLLCWCLAVVNVLGTPRAMRYALVAWSWSGIFWAGVVIVGWAGHITFLEGLNAADGNRVLFTFGDPNYASWYWITSLFVVYAVRSPARLWLRLAGYAMLLWALVLTESNGGMLALIVGLTFLLLIRAYRRFSWPGVVTVVLSLALVGGAFVTFLPQLRQRAASSNQPLLVNSLGRSAQSTSERSLLIQESTQLYQRSDGIIGLGPASTKPLLAAWNFPYANEAHDDYLAALTERGALGLFAFLLLGASAVGRAAPIVRWRLSPGFAAAVPRPVGLVAALLAFSVNSYYEEIQHVRFLWLLLGIVAVLGWDARSNRVWRRRKGRRRRRVLPVWRRPVWRRPGDGARGGAVSVSWHAISNLGAQGGALACVSVASLLVARIGGPAVVGEYALLRVLPWLFGVLFSAGLPTAASFFMAGEYSKDPRLRPTLSMLASAGSTAGAALWLVCTNLFHALFFRQLPVPLITVMGVVVITQLWTVTAKGCCQGRGDITGANLIIVAEEMWFIPTYVGVLLAGVGGATAVVSALVISGILATATGLGRLAWGGFFRGWGMVSLSLAKKVSGFGARGQLGNMLWLMNLRFDFVLLGALAGPAVVGIYAVASKLAELMRLAPTAINYVLYPRFARLGPAPAAQQMRRLMTRATALTLVLTPVLAVGALALPIVYGRAFRAAVLPADVIVIGLSVEGAAAIASAFLLGRGRPGLNSAGMAVGATLTVTLDVLLIPRYGVMGGAATSAVAYLVTTAVLVILSRRLASREGSAAAADGAPVLPGGRAIPRHARPHAGLTLDSVRRRTVDFLVATSLLTVLFPLLTLLAAMVKITSRGPVLYRQVRVGRAGKLFTILKFRSMVTGADRSGPLITGRADPRVTRVGRWLRAAKLDELPQLLNVIRGDMTIIGPRPEVPRFIPFYRDDELATLAVRPGLTCSGQIYYTNLEEGGPDGAGDPESQYVARELHPKLALDLEYLRHRSLRSDLDILARTAGLLVRTRKRVTGNSRQAPEML